MSEKPLKKQSGVYAVAGAISAAIGGWAAAKWNVDAAAIGDAIVALVTLVLSLIAAFTAHKVD